MGSLFNTMTLICNLAPEIDPLWARNAAAQSSDTPTLVGHISRGEHLVVPHALLPQVDYSQTYWFFTHPEAFPNATGFRPKGMTEETWVQLLLRRYRPPGFTELPLLTADLINVLQRHQVNRWTDIKLRMTPQMLQRVGRMDRQVLVDVLDALKAGKTGRALDLAMEGKGDDVKDLVKCFKFVSSHVIGSPYTMRSLRSKHLGGSWLTFGPCTMSVTFNPAPQHCQLVFELMGRSYTFDLDGAPNRAATNPDGSPNLHRQLPRPDRMRLIASHPGACADFFQTFVRGFADIFLGWPVGAAEQQDPDCMLGHVSCWFAKAENTQAGDLHAHWCVWQPALDIERVRTQLEHPDSKARLFDFLESVQRQWLPDPAMVCPELGIVAKDPTLTPAVEVHARGSADLAMEYQPVLTDRWRWQRTVGEAICERLNHQHSFTCAKCGGKATHCNCRLRMPRPVFAHTTAYLTGIVRLQRCGPMIVPHLTPLVMAQPCNNMAFTTLECSRWAREVILFAAANPDAPASDPHFQPPDLAEVRGPCARALLVRACPRTALS